MKRKGDILLQSEPFVYVLSHKERGRRCDSCFESGEDLKRCTVCKVVRYCNSACQKADWTSHRGECPCLKRVFPDVPLDSVRLMLKLILKQKAGDNGESVKKDIGWRKFSDFLSHSSKIKSDQQRVEQLSRIVFTLGKLLGDSNLPPANELLEIFGKMVINSFTVCDGEMQSIGVAIYLSPSLLDHSCEPNAVVTFQGTRLTVRATKDIQEPSPANISISYLDQLATIAERQKQLQEQYYFSCQCNRCQDNGLDGEMLSVRCQSGCCRGYHQRQEDDSFGNCNDCSYQGNKIRKEEVDRFCVACQESLRKIKEDSKNDPLKVLQLCKQCEEEQKQFFTDHNVHCVHLLVKAFDAGIESGQWETALKYGTRVQESYRKFYPPNSPHVGIELMKVGKIQLYLEQCQQALITLQQAETILSITHGRSQPLYEDLSDLIHRCTEEMRVKMQFSIQD
ncbi:histone-lysine N-methyltransferase SMYD3-like [Mizuhopecten yessoensis]|uniref:Histone-lysine N-methyltransferase SMYD3 n=1 Tax=Mizuhopecten yessoensis TaxID=6573 RepID=A0A210QMG6_MIZYE|nr:histone-lysine N-methyltransferase SMYD3-like [Mizuhopecten yessoensis]OWF49924.1 Histone-lysine N-methyltransferase SMYD3 [Mizuhopecten yessoensis]